MLLNIINEMIEKDNITIDNLCTLNVMEPNCIRVIQLKIMNRYQYNHIGKLQYFTNLNTSSTLKQIKINREISEFNQIIEQIILISVECVNQ